MTLTEKEIDQVEQQTPGLAEIALRKTYRQTLVSSDLILVLPNASGKSCVKAEGKTGRLSYYLNPYEIKKALNLFDC